VHLGLCFPGRKRKCRKVNDFSTINFSKSDYNQKINLNKYNSIQFKILNRMEGMKKKKSGLPNIAFLSKAKSFGPI
tara:strand:+ start:1041 stop:1268 length:228 start_codon:yes stop_codon:yes gene_type:complete